MILFVVDVFIRRIIDPPMLGQTYFYRWCGLLLLAVWGCSCSPTKKTFHPAQKYSAAALQEDYTLFQNILEERHPSLYWHSSKAYMDSVFDAGRKLITDSLTEQEFRKILMAVSSQIQCGHTTVEPSKSYSKYFQKNKPPINFPLSIKTWNDTAVVVASRLKNIPINSGDLIDSLNDTPVTAIIDTMFRFVAADGNNPVAKSQRISFDFGNLYALLYGTRFIRHLSFKDSTGQSHRFYFKPIAVKKDSLDVKPTSKTPKISRKEKLKQARSFEIKAAEGYAIMELNSFSEKLQLQSFLRRSFKELHKTGIPHLILDLRLNGGGRLSNANALLRYLTDHSYKLADSIYAITSKSAYSKYIEKDFWNKLIIKLGTQKRNGKLHYTHLEKQVFKPKKKYHFDGQVFLLSGGFTYSASTIVLNILKGQSNVQIVGEPSGGGAYGNTAMLIPDVTLPHSKVRFRLPLFRMVVNKNEALKGQGVPPDVFVGPSLEAIRRREDYKMKKAIELIKNAQHVQ